MSKFNIRLKELRVEAGLSQMDFSKQLSLYLNNSKSCSKSSINMYERGEREPGLEILEAIADYFNVDMDYLLGKSDCKRKVVCPNVYETENIFDIPNLMPLPKTYSVPLLGEIACGDPILAEQNIIDQIPVPEHIKGADFALTCKGDSMINARIHDGDIVYIHQQPNVENGQIAAVLIENEATLKRVRRYENKIVLYPENPAYEPLIFTGEELENIKIIGRAIAFLSPVK